MTLVSCPCTRHSPNMEQAEPKRPYSRRDKLDPRFTMSSIDTIEPNLAICRTEIVEPSCMKSMTERRSTDPIVVLPNTLNPEPARMYCRSEMEEPICRKSEIEQRLPSAIMRARTESELPRVAQASTENLDCNLPPPVMLQAEEHRTKLRVDRELPSPRKSSTEAVDDRWAKERRETLLPNVLNSIVDTLEPMFPNARNDMELPMFRQSSTEKPWRPKVAWLRTDS
mmetsp:Transcript_3482/g.8217  ORF Transcript_3482/g.8217 Transcript_3482/m.8217 type:complete len:226 (-) Transcript_3482:2652-3329(-)